jgi:D-amino-acid dehydrogenase
MHIVVVGAGIIGTSTAWYLAERGHQVTVVERQADAALETSFANAGQISVSHCEPWAHRDAPLKALKWMFSKEAPLLFRLQWPLGEGWQQYRWSLRFLAECNDAAFHRNVGHIVALGAYSHVALKELVAQTGIDYHRLERGISHFFTTQAAFDGACELARLMQQFGVQRKVISTAELLRLEPSLAPFGEQIVGATFTASDESGDARVFTQALARDGAARGVEFLFSHRLEGLEVTGATVRGVRVRPLANEGATSAVDAASAGGSVRTLAADAVVVACGSFSAPLLRRVGVDLPIYPGKGYSATFPILRHERAPSVSVIDDSRKIAITRLGDQIRVAGTIEVGGYDLGLDSPVSQARCQMLARRVEEIWPGMCDTRLPHEGGNPQFWAGLRPATPTNIPYIGQTPVRGLWVNAGHGTLGWTHGAGSGKALAARMDGENPIAGFPFCGA